MSDKRKDLPSKLEIFEAYAFDQDGNARHRTMVERGAARLILSEADYRRLSEPGFDGDHAEAIREGLEAVAAENRRLHAVDTKVSHLVIAVATAVMTDVDAFAGTELKFSAAPPELGWWLLALTIPRDQLDFVVGDLSESYAKYVDERGRNAALWWYWVQISGSFFHFGLRFLKNLLPVADLIKAFKGG